MCLLLLTLTIWVITEYNRQQYISFRPVDKFIITTISICVNSRLLRRIDLIIINISIILVLY